MSEIKVVQHIPAFVQTDQYEKATVSDVEAVLVLPFVAQWSDDPEFARWSVADRNSRQPTLMAEMKDGKFWVVAFLYGGTPRAALRIYAGGCRLPRKAGR